MFGNLFKSKEIKNPLTKDILWEDKDIRWFLRSNDLKMNKDCYSEEDLINIKNAIEEQRKRDIEENHKMLYELLNKKYGEIPRSQYYE